MGKPIVISILGDTRDLIRGVGKAESRLGKFGRVAGGVGKIAAGGLAVAGAAAIGVGFQLIKAGEAAGTSNARIKQVAESMGLFGEQTDRVTNRLITYAEATARQTGVDQNAIKATQAKLLTFKDLAKSADTVGGAFDRATAAAVDLEAAGFGSAASNAVQLGKALNDPIKGLTALSRSGVTFTAAEKDRISTMVEAGKVGKAQNLILKAIETQVGGTAKATANGTDRMRVGYTQVTEYLGGKLVPIVDKTATWFLDVAVPALKTFGDTIARDVVPIVAGFADTVGSALDQVGPAFDTYAGTLTGTVLPAVLAVGGYLADTFGPVLGDLAGVVVNDVLPVLSGLATFVYGSLVPAVVEIATKVGEKLRPVLDAAAGTIREQLVPTVSKIARKFEEWRPTIERVTLVVVKITGKVLEFAAGVLGKVLPPVIRFAGFLVGTMVGSIIKTIDVIIKITGKVIAFGAKIIEAGKKVADFAVDVRDTIAAIPGKILDVFANAGTLLLDIGGKIIGGLLRGLQEKLKDLPGALKGAGSQIASAINPFDRAVAPPPAAELDVAAAGGRQPARFSRAALATYASARAAPGEVRITLTAEQLDQLERGRRIHLDLKAYRGATAQ